MMDRWYGSKLSALHMDILYNYVNLYVNLYPQQWIGLLMNWSTLSNWKL